MPWPRPNFSGSGPAEPRALVADYPEEVKDRAPVLEEVTQSPLLIYDVLAIEARLALFRRLVEGLPGGLLYSVKALPLTALLRRLKPWVAGFSVSSPFEARLAGEVLEGEGLLHLTSPGLRPGDLALAGPGLTEVSFNSLSQWDRFAHESPSSLRLGLRINPGISEIDDPRYDPCRPLSKLGVPLEHLKARLDSDPLIQARLSGLHLHAHFRCRDPLSLRKMLARMEGVLGFGLPPLEWLNLGGGYLLESPTELDAFRSVLEKFSERFKGRLYLEPGQGLVGAAGTLRTTVLDVFEREGTTMAILDTGVHHLPEVFEYQRPPHLLEAKASGRHEVLLAGSSCLAGDLFGRYRLDRPIAIGETLHFTGVGAYSLVKASRFNGHDLPAVAFRTRDGRLLPIKSYGYADYQALWC